MLDWRKWPEGEECTYRVWCFQRTAVLEAHCHTHNFHELFWVESGQGIHLINGERRVIKAGDLVLIRAEDRHAFGASGNDYLQFVNVSLRKETWERLRRTHFKKERAYFSEADLDKRSFKLDRLQLERLNYLSLDMKNGARDALALESFLMGLCSMLRHPREKDSPEGVPGWLAKACQQVQDFPNFAGGPPTLVRLAGRSPEHVARACRKYLQRRPCDVVNEARMHYAARELRQGDRPVLDLALDCGIENLGHFYKLFRERYGIAPVDYRRRERHANPTQV